MKSDLRDVLADARPYDLDDYIVVVFGAGVKAEACQRSFEREKIRPLYYLDNDKTKGDTVFHGIPVVSVEKFVSLRQTFNKPILVLICSGQYNTYREMSLLLQKHELACTTVDAVVFKKNEDKIKTVCDLLEDDFSKDVYTRLIQARIGNSPVPESVVSSHHEQYFSLPPFLELSVNEVFVDLGAYVGDTIEQYLNSKRGMFGKIYAFEPDTVNFTALRHRTARLKNDWAFSDEKLTLIKGGAGLTSARMYTNRVLHSITSAERAFDLGMTDVRLISEEVEGAEAVEVYAIDDYFKEQYVSFIKADIENYELDMLRGGQGVIKRDRPLLAICLYHTPWDMYEIPLYVKELCSDYKLKVRHHTYGLAETVLYAYV